MAAERRVRGGLCARRARTSPAKENLYSLNDLKRGSLTTLHEVSGGGLCSSTHSVVPAAETHASPAAVRPSWGGEAMWWWDDTRV